MKNQAYHSPDLLVATTDGEIIDLPDYEPTGRSGRSVIPVPYELWSEKPHGSDLFILPERIPVGINRLTKKIEALTHTNGCRIYPVAVFPPPAYTLDLLCGYRTGNTPPPLPLFAYAPAGWDQNRIVTTVFRVDSDIRQDPSGFHQPTIEKAAGKKLRQFPENRLNRHLITNCVLKYGCPAARNYVLERWEMPLPTSPACNARCVGCISKQTAGVPSTQDRLTFTPVADEIVEITLAHFRIAPKPVASFGQGCEGEPLTNATLIGQAVRSIRENTRSGFLNINTNGSDPDAVEHLCRSGMDSFRISLNSTRSDYYHAYFRPVRYTFDDVIRSMKIIKRYSRFLSLNYLVLPGFTDTPDEKQGLYRLLQEIPVDMIQWRNLNMDPDGYLDAIRFTDTPATGVRRLVGEVHAEFPKLRMGYFNPHDIICTT